LSEPKSHQDLRLKFFYLLSEASKAVMHSEEAGGALCQIFDELTYLLLLVKLI